MVSTAIVAGTFAGALVASVALYGLFLRLGLRWARVANVGSWGVAIVVSLTVLSQAVCTVLQFGVSEHAGDATIAVAAGQLAAAVLVPCILLMALFRASVLQALKAWLPTVAASAIMLAGSSFVGRPFVYDAFVTPSNSMAPTLLGPHVRATCRECGRPNYCSPHDPRRGKATDVPMICAGFHITTVADVDGIVYAGDRFVVARFLAPRRWDPVIFAYPGNPANLYVARLVGLPGETITIRAGSVWANGAPLVIPDSLSGLVYETDDRPHAAADRWGSVNRPAELGDDEFFVLGDFSVCSRDSRWWDLGAEGHNPFAVPRKNIKGVVTHTFWPPSRWKVHR